jgi:carboxymethylenebutenolidase
MGEIVSFASNSHGASGYLATAPGGSGPGVILIQEYWGLVPHIIDVAERLAAEGFTVLAPDLYHGQTTTEPDEAGKLMMAMNVATAGQDMGGAIDHLLSLDSVTSQQVGVVGFCMGGGLALVLACQRPDAVGAVVPFYGLIPWPEAQPDYSQLDAPVLGHYAADDGYFTPELVDALQVQLDELGKQADLEVYPGVDHAFFNDTRPEVYDAEAAARAWVQTVGFLHANLDLD